MKPQPGLASGYHEQRQHGWPRKSRTWDGDKWIPSEEYDTNWSKGLYNRGFRQWNTLKTTVGKVVGGIDGVLDSFIPSKEELPKELHAGIDFMEQTAQMPVRGAINLYNTLPEDARNAIANSFSKATEYGDQALINYSHALNVHPGWLATGTAAAEMFGPGAIKKGGKFLKDVKGVLAISGTNRGLQLARAGGGGVVSQADNTLFKSINKIDAGGIEGISGKFITTRNLDLNQKQLIAAQKLIVDNYTKEIARLKAAGKSKNRIALIERKLRDARISPPKAIIEEFLGGVSERGYQRVGTKNVYGGTKDLKLIQETVKKGDDLIQHHLLLNAEGGSLGTKYAMMNDLYRVNMWQWLAKGGITPGHLKNNMALIARNPHIKELHPMLKSLGFDDYIRKLPNDLSGQQLFEAMEVWRENVYLPSLALTEDLIASGHKTLITVNPDNTGLILPQHVMNAIKKKNTTLADNLADYLTDLKYERPLSPLPKSDGRRHIGGR